MSVNGAVRLVVDEVVRYADVVVFKSNNEMVKFAPCNYNFID